jgi:hypothetical protein
MIYMYSYRQKRGRDIASCEWDGERFKKKSRISAVSYFYIMKRIIKQQQQKHYYAMTWKIHLLNLYFYWFSQDSRCQQLWSVKV